MTTAIIGGTGVYALGDALTPFSIPTPYGDVLLHRGRLGGHDLLFLARHGAAHSIPPHRINYRANIWALAHLGVDEVLATQAVGSLNARMTPGDIVLLAQFLDWTRGRTSTFFDGEDETVVHVDVSHPYCPRLNGALLRAGEFLGDRMHGQGVYACTEGPRFETAAEIHALRVLGADLVGMTNVPEVVLAREAGLCYASICVVCNWAAGMTQSPLTQDEVLGVMDERRAELVALLQHYLTLRAPGACDCAQLGFRDPVLSKKALAAE
jgi:5'-methylthioadenosine phosphorylase